MRYLTTFMNDRKELVNILKNRKFHNLPLTKEEEEILIKEEIVRHETSLFRIYQIGDPAKMEEKRLELIKLIDEELERRVCQRQRK